LNFLPDVFKLLRRFIHRVFSRGLVGS